mmetsp:Transcript_12023/g.17537  ORF Transcript_12023/g.17537 Transcript_12023/m.17537 type:complete len:202 (+) Transcript_12023:53-658(+)
MNRCFSSTVITYNTNFKQNLLKSTIRRPGLSPSYTHLITQLRMIRLELPGSFSKAHNRRVHCRCHNTHHDTRQDKPDQKSKHESNTSRTVETVVCKDVLIHTGNEKSNQSCHQGVDDTHHKQHILRQIISDDGSPSLILEKGNDILSSIQVTVSIQTNVNISPFVEVFDDPLNTCQETVNDAREKLCRIIVLRSQIMVRGS